MCVRSFQEKSEGFTFLIDFFVFNGVFIFVGHSGRRKVRRLRKRCVMFDDVVMMDDMYLKEGQKLGREHAMKKERERMMKTR